MSTYGYWDGTVLCPRKGLTHINDARCLELHDSAACHPCKNMEAILERRREEAQEESIRRAERKALSPRTKREKP